jgi:hypothetical protein
LVSELRKACVSKEDWPDNVIAAVQAGLGFAAREPGAAQILVLDSLTEPEGVRRYDLMIDILAEQLHEAGASHSLPGVLQERTLIAGICGLVAIRLTLDQAGTLPAVSLEAAEFLLAPYSGDAQVRQLIADAIDRSLSGRG